MKKILIFLWLSAFIQCHTPKKTIPMLDNRFEKITKNFEDRLDESTDKEYVIYTSANIGFGEAHYNKEDYFMQVKNYYPSRNIENKGIAFNEGAPIGIWYYFDESGKLIKEENTDDGYDFTPKDVVKYCESHKIKLPKGYQDSGYKTSVYKKEIDGKKVWQISYVIAVGKEEFIEEIILDGKTGKLIKKKQVSYINN